MATKSIPKKTAADNQRSDGSWAELPDKWAHEDFHHEMSNLVGEALALGQIIEPCIRDADPCDLHAIANGDLTGESLVYLAGMLLNKLHELNREMQP